MSALLGLAVLGLVWAGALCGTLWSWDRYLQRALAAGVEISSEHREYKLSTVFWLNVRGHTIGWSAFYLLFFVVLGLAGFAVWQRLGIGFMLALYYGYLRASRAMAERGDQLSLFSPNADRVWYFVILSAEWLGYFGVLVFAGELLIEAFR